MNIINFGVIGCGGIAKKSTIDAIVNAKNAKLVSVYDINAKAASEIAKKYNVNQEESIQSLVSNPNINAVYIATPVGTHFDMAVKAANCSKHILCEKSLTASLQQTTTLVNLCKSKNLCLLEGFMYKFHTQHQKVKQLIDSGVIGTPILFEAKFGFPPLASSNFRYSKKLGGGACLDAGAYVINAACNFFKAKPIAVYSTLYANKNQVDTNGTVMMDFGNGKTANLAFGFNNYYQNTYSVWGSLGLIKLNRAFSIPANFSPTLIIEKQDEQKILTLKPCNHFIYEVETFVNNLNCEETKNIWYDDAINQSTIINKILQNINTI